MVFLLQKFSRVGGGGPKTLGANEVRETEERKGGGHRGRTDIGEARHLKTVTSRGGRDKESPPGILGEGLGGGGGGG